MADTSNNGGGGMWCGICRRHYPPVGFFGHECKPAPPPPSPYDLCAQERDKLMDRVKELEEKLSAAESARDEAVAKLGETERAGPALLWFDEDRGPACHRCAECLTELETPHTWAECVARVKERENAWLEQWLTGTTGVTVEMVRGLRCRSEAAERALRTLREACCDYFAKLDAWDDGASNARVALAALATAPAETDETVMALRTLRELTAPAKVGERES